MSTSKTSIALLLVALPGTTGVEAQQAHDHAQAADPLVIEVDMRDYLFAPTPLRIPAGQPVTLVFTNSGEVAHEFMAGRSPVDGAFELDLFEGVVVETGPAPGDAMSHDHPTDMPHDHDDGAAHDHGAEGHGTMVELEEGGRATMTFTLPVDRRGQWEMACFLPRHYERGMQGVLTVY